MTNPRPVCRHLAARTGFHCVLPFAAFTAHPNSSHAQDVGPQVKVAPSTAAVSAVTEPACDPQGALTSLRLGFVGDIFVGPRAEKQLAGPSGTALKKTLAALKRWTPLLIGNLEGALTRRTVRAFPEQTFAHRMDPSLAARLAEWGFSGLTLANNHTMDYGFDGLQDTTAHLSASGLRYTGAGQDQEAAEQPMVFEQNGLKAHVLSFNATFPEEASARKNRPGLAYPQLERLRKRVEQSTREADLVVVSFHWGQEGSRSLRDYQPIFARAAVAAGADFVYGHHTHSVQPIERVGQTTIAYGLGNFVFDAYSSSAAFGLAALVQLCAQSPRANTANQNPNPSKGTSQEPRRIDVTFVPLNTFNYATQFGTVPMTRRQFAKASQDYFLKGDFPSDTKFFWPD